jgi:hypothetical protein
MKNQGIVAIIRYYYQKAQLEFSAQVRSVINAKIVSKLISEHREREVISSDKAKSKIPNSEPKNVVESTPISNSKLGKGIINN